MAGGFMTRGRVHSAFVALLAIVFVFLPVCGQAALPTGLPPIHFIAPAPDTFPRFYTVAQAPDGLIHVGGTEGVHSHDGRRWHFMPMPNGNIVRSLLHDGGERLYVGGYGQFGFAEKAPDGQLQFIDLTPAMDQLPGENILADIWDIQIAPEGVYFGGVHHLFLYDPSSEELQHWYHAGRFGVITRIEERTLVQFRGVGLKSFNGSGFELVDGGEQLSVHVFALLPLPGGGLLTLGRDGLWQRFHEGRLWPWPAPEGLPGSDAFSAWQVLADGTFALAMPDGSLYLLDPFRYRQRHFQAANDYINHLALAIDGGLLAQSDLGTLHVAWPSSWTRIGPEAGLRGRISSLSRWQDHWLIITNAGVQRLVNSATGRSLFERVDYTAYEAWDWLPLPSGTGLLADSYTIVEIEGESVRRWEDETLYPRLLKLSPSDSARLHVGTELGLALYEQVGDQWQQRFFQRDFTGRVRSIVELDPHELLLAIDDHGLVRVRYSEDYSELIEWQVLDRDDGVDYGPLKTASIARLDDGRLVASTSAGFHAWEDGRFVSTAMDGLDDLRQSDTLYRIQAGPDQTRWAFSHERIFRQPSGGSWKLEDISALQPGMISSLNFSDNGVAIVGGIATLLQFDPHIEPIENRPAEVALRSVILTDGDGHERRLPLDGSEIRIAHDLVNMVFEYALPNYIRPEMTRYQARLEGYEDYFSDWGSVTRITFSNFRPGEFSFVVRARDGQGRISESAPFEFVVLKPWYLTFWAMLTWIVTGIVLLMLVTRTLLRRRIVRLTEERERLSRMVQDRTAELAAANKRLKNMANVDGLTSVANRRRLEEYLDEAWTRCVDRQCELSIILLDVDHFKRFNDTHGHQAGDDVLREVANILSATLRRGEDIVARYGGEEFMCVMPGAGAKMAMDVAETMRQRVEDSNQAITASVGLATGRPGSGQSLKDLIEQADRALYQAKQSGRNQTCQAS
jgi:diguanylate cyclase (GGDEF)-like protein